MIYWDKRKRSHRQESLVAQKFAGRVQPVSGARHHSKGDVLCREMLIECKYTDAAGYRLTLGTWRKIQEEAAREGKTGVMVLEIQGHRLCVVPEHVLEVYTQKGT